MNLVIVFSLFSKIEIFFFNVALLIFLSAWYPVALFITHIYSYITLRVFGESVIDNMLRFWNRL